MSEPKSRKITVQLSSGLLKILEAEVQKIKATNPNARVTRADAIRTLILKSCHDHSLTADDRKKLYNEYMSRSDLFKQSGTLALANMDSRKARRAFLQAVNLELEALAILDDPSEQITARILAETVLLLKKATGYRALPDTQNLIISRDLST